MEDVRKELQGLLETAQNLLTRNCDRNNTPDNERLQKGLHRLQLTLNDVCHPLDITVRDYRRQNDESLQANRLLTNEDKGS